VELLDEPTRVAWFMSLKTKLFVVSVRAASTPGPGLAVRRLGGVVMVTVFVLTTILIFLTGACCMERR